MRRFLEIAFVLLIGLGIGGAVSWLSIQNRLGFGALRLGAWTSWPLAGSAGADPYTRAKVAAEGEIPLGAAEGIAFLARTDDAGEPLRRECRYTLVGRTPPARFWTLSAHDLSGAALAHRAGSPAAQRGLVSRELLREADGSVQVTVGRGAGAANWLPTQGSGPYQLVLRLYDAQLAATEGNRSDLMPAIRFAGCPA